MKISVILDHIDTGFIALPEFQRGFVWNRDQVRGFFDSLYRRHPVGGLLVWSTEAKTATHRGDGELAAGVVKLLLDGQQRVTSLYGIIRGKAPKFFDGNEQAFNGLYFNLENETFNFYQPLKMKDDPLWINVSVLMQEGNDGLGIFISKLNNDPVLNSQVGKYASRLSKLIGINDIDLHIEEVTGADKSLDVVVDIFNRVNSGGTKLSKGDLALAKICAEWPEARDVMKAKLNEWEKAGYSFNLDWLLRSVNTILTGEAKFQFLHDKSTEEISDALNRSFKQIDKTLNIIGNRLGLDHDRVLFGRFAIPVIVRYLDQKNTQLTEVERDKILFWFIQAGMWGRFSGSTESFIDQDLSALDSGNSLDGLIEQLRLWHGSLKVEPSHFIGWSLGARFYPVLYLLTRMCEARDWGNGVALKANMLGSMSQLEVHHIFPKAQLYKKNFKKPEVNALANYCFLSKETNLAISDRLPEEYFPEIESNHPGALASQWIPMDPQLWRIENYLEFLEARKELLANETNSLLSELLHGETEWLEGPTGQAEQVIETSSQDMFVVDQDVDEEEKLENLQAWMKENNLPEGEQDYDFADSDTGEQKAVFDLAWTSGIQKGLTQPVAIIIDDSNEILPIASRAGFRCFTSISDFKNYIEKEILAETSSAIAQ